MIALKWSRRWDSNPREKAYETFLNPILPAPEWKEGRSFGTGLPIVISAGRTPEINLQQTDPKWKRPVVALLKTDLSFSKGRILLPGF